MPKPQPTGDGNWGFDVRVGAYFTPLRAAVSRVRAVFTF